MSGLILLPLRATCSSPVECRLCAMPVSRGLLDMTYVPSRRVHAGCLRPEEREEGLRNGERMQAYYRDMAADHDAHEGRYHGD